MFTLKLEVEAVGRGDPARAAPDVAHLIFASKLCSIDY